MNLQPIPDKVCGYIQTGPTGIRWICILAPHGPDDPPPPGVDPRYWNREAHYFRRLDLVNR